MTNNYRRMHGKKLKRWGMIWKWKKKKYRSYIQKACVAVGCMTDRIYDFSNVIEIAIKTFNDLKDGLNESTS